MGRPSKLAGAAVFAVLLLGCSGVPQARRGADQEAPDGVDYIRAVQCGGLLWALGAVTDDSGQLESMTGLFRQWAEARAREAGQDPGLAVGDITASKKDFLAGARGGTNDLRRASLHEDYPGDVNACQSLAHAADFVVIGG
jgi:hypothetical protein